MSKPKYHITTVKEVEKMLRKNIEGVLKDIGEDTCEKLRVYTKQYWYDRYTPEDYERTYSLLNSISYEIDGMHVHIYYDFDSWEFSKDRADAWGQHVGFDYQDFTEGLIEFVENGKFYSGRLGSHSNPRIGDKSLAIEKTQRWLDKYLNQQIRKRLERDLGVKFRI